MNIISAENISKTLNEDELFKEITIGLDDKDKIGFVGQNGSGKSTFLKVFSGLMPTDTGTVSKRNDADISFLSQTVTYNKGAKVKDYLYESECKKISLLKAYEKEVNPKRQQELFEEIEKIDAFSITTSYDAFLSKLGVFHLKDSLMETLSGGEQKKVAIARCFAEDNKIVLLDEITNHLDIATIEYIESYIASSNKAYIIVSHDRYFLDAVCTSIWELDRQTIFSYPGSYSIFVEKKAERLDMLKKGQKRIETILRRELTWLKRGPQARTGKDKNRKERIDILLSKIENVEEKGQTSFSSLFPRIGKTILNVNEVSHFFDSKELFNSFTYHFLKGDKIGLIGKNGSGKSTLLDIIAGITEPKSGNVEIGQNTKIAYYDQLSRNLNMNKSVIDFIEDIATRIAYTDTEVSAAKFLELFGFDKTSHVVPINLLSGGEKRRLYLISRLVTNPNFLILDEPTNDLDIKTMENLEDYIASFPGSVIITSHDRAFLDSVCDKLFIIDDSTIKFYDGPYSSYAADNEKNISEKKEVKEKVNYQKNREEKKGLSYKENKEYESLEIEIAELEDKIKVLEEYFSASISPEELKAKTDEYNACLALLDEKSERWLELAEKL